MPMQIFKFNNSYVKKYENPNDNIKQNLQNIDTTRKSDCNTPFLMPLKIFRRTSECNNCTTNEKILKDNTAINFNKDTCYNPYITRKQNLNGFRDTKFVYNSFNLLFRDNKTYYQNTQSNYQSNTPINGTMHDFQNAPPDPSNNSVSKCNVSTTKFTNYLNQSNGGSSGRNRIQALKRNTILGAQHNNSVNRTLISIQGVGGNMPYRNDKIFYNDMKTRGVRCATIDKATGNKVC